MTLRQFEPTTVWSDKDGLLTERAKGYLRGLWDYIGAASGIVPAGSLGGDGTTTKFYRADGTFAVPAYPTAANPTSSIGTAAVNGTAVTFLRSDAAPALSQSITPTWTGAHTFSALLTANAGVSASTLASTSTLTTTTSATIGTAFGCNGKTAQTAATANAAIAATAGAAYTATEQGMLNDLKALTNQIRAALVANGIMV
jgi:hypothetical protein